MKILLILFFASIANAINIDSQIAGGTTANPHQFPFAVVVFSRQTAGGAERLCAGALISRQSILTAASCVHVNFGVRVGLGIHDLSDLAEPFAVWMDIQTIIVNPGFASDSTMDIAILRLPNAIGFFNQAVQIISLPNDNQQFINTAGNALGWGCANVGLNPANCMPTLILRSASVTTTTCAQPHLICSSNLVGGSICHGDEGGPLFTTINNNFVLMGINHNFPSLCAGTMNFVRITSFLPWIRQFM